MTKDKKTDNFDFTGANEISEDEIATGGNPEEEIRDAEAAALKAKLTPEEQLEEERIDEEIKEDQRAAKGFPTAKVIAEARALAETRTGLPVSDFFIKHQLVNVNLEQLLNAPLHEDGPKKGTFK